MRSSFLGMIGAPKTDLRKRHRCAICGVRITSKNYGVSSASFEDDGWSGEKVYCSACYLKPEALFVGKA